MMLTEFQARYPQGSLISELLTIYQGKFVVRVLVQVDGVIRASGMAAAQTPELAEDEARMRALAVMAIDQASAPLPSSVSTQPVAEVKPDAPLQTAPASAPAQPNFQPTEAITTIESLSGPTYNSVSPPITEFNSRFKDNSSPYSEGFQNLSFDSTLEAEETTTAMEDFGVTLDVQAKNSDFPSLRSPSDETSIFSHNSEQPSDSGFQEPTEVSEPIDLSDDLSLIEVKLKELGWNADQESKYLERTYGKKSHQQLTAQQVQEFRHYLELLSQTSKELKELKWSNQKGQDHLIRTYNKRSRQQLTHQELQEFLEYLQSERRR